jgi:hypothetical protein
MPTDHIEIDEIEKALDTIAEWLIACYGPWVTALSLTLEGFYSPGPEYYGIYPSITRAEAETRETLSSHEVRDLAETIFRRLFPQARIERAPSLDVRQIARSEFIKAVDVTAHRRIELLGVSGVRAAQPKPRQPTDETVLGQGGWWSQVVAALGGYHNATHGGVIRKRRSRHDPQRAAAGSAGNRSALRSICPPA